MSASDISALTIARSEETLPSSTTDFTQSLKVYWRKNAMVQIIIEDDDRLSVGCTKYRGAWNMYFINKKAYGPSAKKQLSNLLAAFFVIEFTYPMVAKPFFATDRLGKTLTKIRNLCKTHYLVLPITRMKESLTGGADIKFVGMTIPARKNETGHFRMFSEDMKIVEACFYGTWANSIDHEPSMVNFRSRTYSNKRGGKYLELYRKYHEDIESKIYRSMTRNMEEVGYAD